VSTDPADFDSRNWIAAGNNSNSTGDLDLSKDCLRRRIDRLLGRYLRTPVGVHDRRFTGYQ
jgi:hypothetical protein